MKYLLSILFVFFTLFASAQPPGISSLNPRTSLRTDKTSGKILISEEVTANGVTYYRYNHFDANTIDNQELSFDTTTNVLALEDGGQIDLSKLDGSEIDVVYDSIAYTLTIGNKTISLTSLLDNTDNQQLEKDGNIITLEDGGQIDLSDYENTDNQQLGRTGNFLTLENGGQVDLSQFLDNTDSQLLGVSYPNDSTALISISSGNTISVKLGAGGTDAQLLHFYEVFDNQSGGSITTTVNLGNLPDLNKLNVFRPGIGRLSHDSGGTQRDYSVSGPNIIFHEPLDNERIIVSWVE